MKFVITVLAAMFAVIFSAQAVAIRAATSSSPTLYIFGDSLSDIGTLKQMTLGLVPGSPYWKGRFSSGPVWNEYLSLLLSYNLYNKAIGGSTSDNTHATLIDILNIHIPSTQDQINYFKFITPFYTLDSTRSQDIAVLEVGANDYFVEQSNIANGTLSASSFIDTLSTTVVSQLDQLRQIGFQNIAVANMAAIQYTPMARQGNSVSEAQQVVTSYNQMLATKAKAWASANPGVTFSISDIGDFVEISLNSHAVISALGITDTADACVNSPNITSFDALVSYAMSGSSSCSDPSTNYFFDSVHPAERVHRLFGYYAWQSFTAVLKGSTYALSEANLLALISQYNLGTPAPKPAAI
ncbi:GDSL-like Lipase/Acylhydrolase-domain-containing protein [Coemansia spiralis]|nr:GDSL-like Lipase/Acylhydrolase-domain-containing protein [Coemansia spiralis]